MRLQRLFLWVLFCLAAAGLTSFAGAQQAADNAVPDHYVVQLRQDVAPQAVISAHGLRPDFVYTRAVKGFAGFVPPGQLRALEQDPSVLSIAPDRVVKAVGNVDVQVKPDSPGKPGGGAPKQVVPEGVKRIGADPANAAFTGEGVGVAVVDTGLDFAHADLAVAPAENSFTTYGASAQDDDGHGTHVGGIIAALNNTICVVGVAPDAVLYAVKVLNSSGSGTDATVIAGLDWVAANAVAVSPPIRVVNMSLGRDGDLGDNPTLWAAVQSLHNAGISITVAAGNDPYLEVSQQVPATYPEVMAIASTSALRGTSKYRFFPSGIAADTASYFTTDGAFDSTTGIGVTVSAPGENQENVTKAGKIQSVGILSTKLGGGTVQMSGTSMSAPHVAGVVARALEADPGADPETIRALIMENAILLSTAPYDSPTSSYSFDGQREGIVSVPELWVGP